MKKKERLYYTFISVILVLIIVICVLIIYLLLKENQQSQYASKLEENITKTEEPIKIPGEFNPAGTEKNKFKIAIIIDDMGAGGKLTDEFLKFQGKITFSILPHLKRSRELAEKIQTLGFEVMLHIPMEPLNFRERNVKLSQGEILTDMTTEKIIETLEEDFSFVPNATGINNHQGSKATSDHRIMTIVLKFFRNKGLFFIDSMASAESVGYKTAIELGMKTATRDVFLDNEPEYNYVKQQMDKLIIVAQRKGKAVGIGHISRKNTIAVLNDYLDEFEKKNIDLVFASEVVELPPVP